MKKLWESSLKGELISMNSIQQRQVPATITHLRAEIEALPRDSGGKRQGISEELKKRIVGALRTSQMPMKEFSSAVAVSISAVTTWKVNRHTSPH